MRLIDADALLTAYCDDCNSGVEKPCPVPGRCHEYNLIKEQPTITAEPVKHGRWNDKPDEYCETNIIRHCSECGWAVFKGNPLYDFGHWKYCPACGARMDAESEAQE